MTDRKDNARTQMVAELNRLLADHFALYIKTKNFHWHVKGPRFRDLHLLFDEQAGAIHAQIDVIAERARKLQGETVTSLSMIAEQTRITDQPSANLSAEDMVRELANDNETLIASLKAMKDVAVAAGDNATDGLIDDWTDEAEGRVWFLNAQFG